MVGQLTLKINPDIEKKASVHNCPRCSLVNAIDNKFCSKCSYPLVPSAFDEIKAAEDMRIKAMEEKHQEDMKAMREEMQSKVQKLNVRADKLDELAVQMDRLNKKLGLE